jgi:hypothetical protein
MGFQGSGMLSLALQHASNRFDDLRALCMCLYASGMFTNCEGVVPPVSASGLDERFPGKDTVAQLSTRLASFTTKRNFTRMAVHPITGALVGCGEASYMPLVRLENRPHLMGSSVGPVGCSAAGNEGNPDGPRLRTSLLLAGALMNSGGYGPALHAAGTCRSEVIGIHPECGHVVDTLHGNTPQDPNTSQISHKCPKCDGEDVRISLLHAVNEVVGDSELALLPRSNE